MRKAPSPTKGVISEITALPRDPNLRRIRIANKTVATLRASDIDALHIEVGDEWTDTLAKRVGAIELQNAARRDALGILSRRAQSKATLIDRLNQKNHDPAIVERIVDELQRNGWLDDARLADSIIHQTTRTKPAAKRLIAAKLAARNIDPTIAAHIAEKSHRDRSESTDAMELALSQQQKYRKIAPSAQIRRIAGALARRGYDDDLISDVIDRLQLTREESSE